MGETGQREIPGHGGSVIVGRTWRLSRLVQLARKAGGPKELQLDSLSVVHPIESFQLAKLL